MRAFSALMATMKAVIDIFTFKVHLDYVYTIRVEQSRTFSEIRESIRVEVRDRLFVFTAALTWVNWFLLLTFAFMICV